MANRDNRFLIKRSNVAGKVPSAGQLLLGEMALNTADVKLFASGTTDNAILPIGWDRISRTGDTMTGDLTINGDLIVDSGITTDTLQFNTGYTGNTIVEGKMYWDEENQTISLGLHSNEVSLQLGQEQHYHISNQSGATIENGKVVRAAGTIGTSGRILGEYMIADGSIAPKFTLGVATHDILNGEEGYVTEFGLVRGIDTTGSLYGETWNDGDVLWVSPTIPGGLTNVEPTVPYSKIELALVIYANANGSIFVRPHVFPHFYDLQESDWSGGTENNLDIIQWNGATSAFTLTNTPTLNSLTITGVTDFQTSITNTTGNIVSKKTIEPETDRSQTLGTSTKSWGNVFTEMLTLEDNSGADQVIIKVPQQTITGDVAWEWELPYTGGTSGQLLGISDYTTGAGQQVNSIWYSLSGVNMNISTDTGGTITFSGAPSTDTNFAEDNLIFDANRLHDLNTNDLTISGDSATTVSLMSKVGIKTLTPGFDLEVNGTFGATSKSFVIDHPTQEGKKLVYGAIEGPEFGVYCRGKIDGNYIMLPEEWVGLVDTKTITIQLTGDKVLSSLYVKHITGGMVTVGNRIPFVKPSGYYTIYGERKDIAKIKTVIDKK